MGFHKVRVCLKELSDQSLERKEIHVGVGVEELKVDLDTALLNKFQRIISNQKKKASNRLCFAPPLVLFLVLLFSFRHRNVDTINQGADGHVVLSARRRRRRVGCGPRYRRTELKVNVSCDRLTVTDSSDKTMTLIRIYCPRYNVVLSFFPV